MTKKQILGRASIIVFNILPLVTAIIYDWKPYDVIYLYWFETLLMIFFSIIRKFFPLGLNLKKVQKKGEEQQNISVKSEKSNDEIKGWDKFLLSLILSFFVFIIPCMLIFIPASFLNIFAYHPTDFVIYYLFLKVTIHSISFLRYLFSGGGDDEDYSVSPLGKTLWERLLVQVYACIAAGFFIHKDSVEHALNTLNYPMLLAFFITLLIVEYRYLRMDEKAILNKAK